ncbi:hypothetical protein [Kitasatospora sp. NPDC050543]|uniref:hypothetical protein n=1 Tax=Kitasatospora sp. NPDC050543 TaxID=3364054 RepID=UPI003788A6FE
MTTRLSDLADEPAPPAGIDIMGALLRGRSRVRRRRLATAGAATALALVAVGGSLALQASGAGVGHTVAPPAATGSATPGPSASASPPASPTATRTPRRGDADPLTTEVRFGWLPDWAGGRAGVGYELGYHGNDAQARGTGERAPRMILSLFPAGTEPQVGDPSGGRTAHRVEAPPVDGRTAYWVVSDNADEAALGTPTLRWMTASGRWAQLVSETALDAGSKDVALRVAADVRFGKADVPLPVKFVGLPGTFTATDVSLDRPAPDELPWDLWMLLSVEGKVVSVNVNPVRPDPTASPTGTDGSPYTDPNPPLCKIDNGMQICVSTPQGSTGAVEQLGGLPGLLTRIKALGVDDSTWTTQVLG